MLGPNNGGHTPRKIPWMPVLLAVVLAAAAWKYSSPPRLDMSPKEGSLRCVTWDVTPINDKPVRPRAVADALNGVNADLIAIQGFETEDDTRQLADLLGKAWRWEAVRGPSGRMLALFVSPISQVTSYHLIPSSAGDALALTVQQGEGPLVRFACLRSPLETAKQVPYMDGLLTWCSRDVEAMTVLAGPLRAADRLQSRLGERFIAIRADAKALPEFHVAPASIQVVQAGRVSQSQVKDSAGQPFLVDLKLP